MGGFVQFVDAAPQGIPVVTLPGAPSLPAPPTSLPAFLLASNPDKDFRVMVEARAKQAPTPLNVMLYAGMRLIEEANLDADVTHQGRLKNGSLQKFSMGVSYFSNAAKYMHATKVDAEIRGGAHEAELSAILNIAMQVNT